VLTAGDVRGLCNVIGLACSWDTLNLLPGGKGRGWEVAQDREDRNFRRFGRGPWAWVWGWCSVSMATRRGGSSLGVGEKCADKAEGAVRVLRMQFDPDMPGFGSRGRHGSGRGARGRGLLSKEVLVKEKVEVRFSVFPLSRNPRPMFNSDEAMLAADLRRSQVMVCTRSARISGRITGGPPGEDARSRRGKPWSALPSWSTPWKCWGKVPFLARQLGCKIVRRAGVFDGGVGGYGVGFGCG
jgi:hypothetical protein